MIINEDYVDKREVVYVHETDRKQDALDKVVESGYRCIPVLDEAGEKYVGNIYKVHLMEEELDGSLDGPTSDLISDQEGYVNRKDPFVKVFSSIKALPFLGVVDDDKTFLGILTNGNIIQVLENAWGVHNGSYSLTIGTIEYAGALRRMLKVVNKYCNLQSVISLNNDSQFVRRVCIVLPDDVDEATMQRVVTDLEKDIFTVTDIEVLQN
ncbi:cyclic di-AMP binding protein CbpA [Lentibacillus amyloliquefaciens]|uniref:Hemolysin-like protein n=1 Tax=Lentibacillus amyloliquefaciens TaxID=1472767 RepID=A0A0U4F9B8_9BACI|nr:cyclic di-AMP binding protein CbpA [Lentibacillus amyloliquefaciens]ALX50198.1 hemolysin-like protein [Lentibacillus amyloliquefaciens]